MQLLGTAYGATSSDTLNVFMIYSTPNPSCSLQEMEEMNIFVQSAKQYLDNVSTKKFEMSSICTPIDEIKLSEFPLLLKSLNIQRPDLLIILGDTKINEDMVIHQDALGLWACTSLNSDFECVSDLILSCTDCEYDNQEKGLETAVWTVSHELSHYFAFRQTNSANYYDIVDGVHVLQQIYDYCSTFNQLEPCNGMYYEQYINGKTFHVMNFDYILKNASEMKYFDISVFAHAENTQPTPEIIEEVVSEPEIITIPEKQAEPVLYQSSEYGFSIMQPGDWVYDDQPVILEENTRTISFWNEEDGFYTSMIEVELAKNAQIPVEMYDRDVFDTVNNFLETGCSAATIDTLGYTCSNFQALETTVLGIQGQKAYEVKYSWTETVLEEIYDNITTVTLVPKNDHIWLIRSTTLSDSFDDLEKEIESTVLSFEETNSYPNTNSELTREEENFLVDLIMSTMDPIFDLVFNIQDNERLQQWGMEIIQRQVETTESQITGQLGYDPRVTCC
jgi:hypothetical protein